MMQASSDSYCKTSSTLSSDVAAEGLSSAVHFTVIARIACFGELMPYAFTSTSPNCRLATERFSEKGYGYGCRGGDRWIAAYENMQEAWEDIEEDVALDDHHQHQQPPRPARGHRVGEEEEEGEDIDNEEEAEAEGEEEVEEVDDDDEEVTWFNYCQSSVGSPPENTEDDEYLSVRNVRCVKLHVRDDGELRSMWKASSWWWYRAGFSLPLVVAIRSDDGIAAVDAAELFPTAQQQLLVVSLSTDTKPDKCADALRSVEALCIRAYEDDAVFVSDQFNRELVAACVRLQSLKLEYCIIESLDWLAAASQLRCLRLFCCEGSVDLSVLKQLPRLESLQISHCFHVSCLSVVGELTDLRCLSISGIEDLHLDALNCIHLESLEWNCAYPYSDLRIFLKFMSLRKLTLSDCMGLTSLAELEKATLLEELWIDGGGALVSVELPVCPRLRMLRLYECVSMTLLRGLERAPLLEELIVTNAAVGSIALPPCPHLKKLSFYDCERLSSVEGLRNVPCLEWLTLSRSNCAVLDLHPCRSLRLLDMSDSQSMQCLLHLECALGLRDLCLSGTSVESLDVPFLPLLRVLELADCRSLKSVTGLSHLPSLTHLYLSSSALRTLFLPPLPCLKRLDLYNCEGLHSIEGLDNVTGSIEELALCGTGIEEIATLGQCSRLWWVFLSESLRESADATVELLQKRGVQVTFG